MQRRRTVIALLVTVAAGLALGVAAQATQRIYLPALESTIPTETATSTGAPTATMSPTDTPTATVGAATATALPDGPCTVAPDPASAPNVPIRIVQVNKVREEITLINDGPPGMVSVAGWFMCSITGDQRRNMPPATIIRGSTLTISQGSAAPIWDDDARDDAALYNAEGQLMAYWIDE